MALLNVNSLCESEPLPEALLYNDNSNLCKFIFIYVVECQFVKAYNDDLAEDEESKTVLETKHLAVFCLCPSGSCSSCQSEIAPQHILFQSNNI